MKIFRAENTSLFGTRWIFAKSEKSAKRIALALGMVKRESNLTIKEMPEDLYEDTNAKEIDIEGVGQLYSNQGKKEWLVSDNKGIFERSSYKEIPANMEYGLNYLVVIDGKFNQIIEELLQNSIQQKQKEIYQTEKDIILQKLKEDEHYRRTLVSVFDELKSSLEIEKQRLEEWRSKKAKSIEKQDVEKIFSDI